MSRPMGAVIMKTRTKRFGRIETTYYTSITNMASRIMAQWYVIPNSTIESDRPFLNGGGRQQEAKYG